MSFIYVVLYIPMLCIYSLLLLISFTVMLNLSSYSIISTIETLVMGEYTSVTRRINLPKHKIPDKFTPSISFMGGGQLWMFAIGVGHFVFENYDIKNIKFLASSSGCFAAVPLACGLDPYEWCKSDWGKCMTHFGHRGILGCLFDSQHFYRRLWDEYLPDDAHIRCSGRLFVSVTLYPSFKNKIINVFHTREDLISAITGMYAYIYI